MSAANTIPRSTSRRMTAGLLYLALWGLAQTALAQGVVIYRCTDASGALTIQNGTPCPKGSKQERRVIEAAPSSSAPPFAPSVPTTSAPKPVVPATVRTPPPQRAPTPPPVEPEPTIADSDRLPPPWLYECHTFDNDIYLSENGAPAPRCVTLTTTGVGGMIESPNTSACEMKTDQCQRVPDGALCDAWRKQLRQGESALRFGVTEDRAKAEAEVQRLTRIVRDSTCGRPQ
jgi:hypothetical protein